MVLTLIISVDNLNVSVVEIQSGDKCLHVMIIVWSYIMNPLWLIGVVVMKCRLTTRKSSERRLVFVPLFDCIFIKYIHDETIFLFCRWKCVICSHNCRRLFYRSKWMLLNFSAVLVGSFWHHFASNICCVCSEEFVQQFYYIF